jgi:hypothetical protein
VPESMGNSLGSAPLSKVSVALVGLFFIADIYSLIGFSLYY